MTPAYRVLFAVALLAVITGAGASGFVFLEGWGWGDALFMAVITLSTVGYNEVQPLSPTGQLFTTGYIVVGVGTSLYLLSSVAEAMVEGRLRALMQRRALLRRVGRMRDHVIVAGYGRFGRAVSEELTEGGCAVVVIESDASLESEFEAAGLAYVIGSAASDDILESAGVKKAKAIVVCTGSEAENVYIVLAARELGPSVRIHARADTESGARRLRRAGAESVVAPFQMGGVRAAASILRPAVVDFVELSAAGRGETIDLEEVRVGLDSPLVGRSVADLEGNGGAPRRIVAIKRASEPIQIVLDGGEIVEAGDHLVVIGRRDLLEELAHDAQAPGLRP